MQLEKYEIYVFSTDINGQHNTEDGKHAVTNFGAIVGTNEGLMGSSYAIPIINVKNGFEILFGEEEQMEYISRFILYAASNPRTRFIISENFGISNKERTITEMRNIFYKSFFKCGFEPEYLPKNIILPKKFI